jgi:hypothetical protein
LTRSEAFPDAPAVCERFFAFKSVERFVQEDYRFFVSAGELEHLGEIRASFALADEYVGRVDER